MTDIGGYGDYCFLGCDIMLSGRKVPKFWRNLMTTSSGTLNRQQVLPVYP